MTTTTGPHRLADDLRAADTPDRRVRTAGLLHLDGDLVGARRLYEELLDDHPDHPVAIANLGLLLQQLGDVDGALALFDRMEPDADLSATALTNWALALVGAGRIESGAALLERAVDTAPDHGPWTSLAKIRLMTSDTAAARAAAETSVRVRPASTESWRVLGTCAGAAGDVDGAIAAFDRVVQLDDSDASAWRQLGAALFARRDLGSAAAATTRALELDASCAAAHHQLAMISMATGDIDAARSAFGAALALRAVPSVVVDLAIAELAAGDHDAAIALLEPLEADGTADARRLLHLGHARLAAGRDVEGVEALSAAAATGGPEAMAARDLLERIAEGSSDG